MRILPHTFAAFLLGVVSFLLPAAAGEWPQVLGPHRNGVADGERLADHWAAGEPKTLWQRGVGRGFAGAAISGNRAITFYREADKEIVEAIELAAGKPIWRQAFDARYQGQIFPDEDGPLCTPLIHIDKVHGDTVIVFGAGGDLRVLALADGKPRWSRALYQEFRTRTGSIDYGYFGAGSSPIVVGDKVLVNVGGRGVGIMALAIDSGRTVWQATDEEASYSSPVATEIGGKPCVVFVARLHCLGVSPADGAVLFRFPFGQRGPTVNAASPVLMGDRLFVSACYGVGAVMTKLTPTGAQQQWANDESLSNHYNTSIPIGGNLYGVDGRADVGTPSLRCVEADTGKVTWTEPDFGAASLLLADNKLLAMRVSGELVLIEPASKGYHRLAGVQILEAPVRALPALSEGHLIVRDGKTMKCLLLPTR
ncbi:MAG: PQQ-like beta-propeller repeat protein [Planctomycetia bacterium]|nr:PQQ-like beta-propeller repeat protein [Planctomycetia bacterium]